jgi:diaminohydroxyphosphoribosylaminopyrimidine deaminase/5-amino-6-(5-phosphoribosylamino)uracil reductase
LNISAQSAQERRSMAFSDIDSRHMRRALALAAQGQGFVEPNPMVGCVIARNDHVEGEGWHESFGQAHAEVNALRAAGEKTKGATAYVTLEPCCHTGKTPPCTDALIAAGIQEVIFASADPFPKVDGGGLKKLQAAGVAVRTGLLDQENRDLNAPYFRRVEQGRPWVIAKWAMTLDGKMASCTGDSQWISNETSRQRVHDIRGRMDAIVVGSQTAVTDDPQLTARPAGARVARRMVIDSKATLSVESQLAKTANQFPTIIVAGPEATATSIAHLESTGVEVWQIAEVERERRLLAMLSRLAAEGCTNVLVEGGGTLLGSLLLANLIDEVHVFIAPKLLGGASATTPIGGEGFAKIADCLTLETLHQEPLDGDIYLHGRLTTTSSAIEST